MCERSTQGIQLHTHGYALWILSTLAVLRRPKSYFDGTEKRIVSRRQFDSGANPFALCVNAVTGVYFVHCWAIFLSAGVSCSLNFASLKTSLPNQLAYSGNFILNRKSNHRIWFIIFIEMLSLRIRTISFAILQKHFLMESIYFKSSFIRTKSSKLYL